MESAWILEKENQYHEKQNKGGQNTSCEKELQKIAKCNTGSLFVSWTIKKALYSTFWVA
jgi:hypothetical protein